MVKYLSIFVAFALVLILMLNWQTNSDYLAESLIISSLLCIPLLLIAIIAWAMGYFLRNKQYEKNTSFTKPFRNLQLILSSCYVIFLIYNFNLFSRVFDTSEEDCTEANIKMIAGNIEGSTQNGNVFDDLTIKKNMLAYQGLKKTLLKIGRRATDTSICLYGIYHTHFDTTILNHQLDTKIIIAFSIKDRPGKEYKYMHCCNDSIGFGVNQNPLATLEP